MDVFEVKNGNPTVYGVLALTKKLLTVTIQPHGRSARVNGDGAWDNDPFVMTKKGDTYLGRGTTDDKGGTRGPLGACAAIEAGIPISIRFLWEFEEENWLAELRKDYYQSEVEPAQIQSWFPIQFGSRVTGPPVPPVCGQRLDFYCGLKPEKFDTTGRNGRRFAQSYRRIDATGL